MMVACCLLLVQILQAHRKTRTPERDANNPFTKALHFGPYLAARPGSWTRAVSPFMTRAALFPVDPFQESDMKMQIVIGAALAVATAASMDGYTAFGASITHHGSKQTFDCPAPCAVLADLEVIAAAPAPMNAWGYADLLAKNVAGADWILADAAGIEPVDPDVWETVQGRLKDWISDPSGVARNDLGALANLIDGLLMSGFAMQAHQTSRPASGAEHQFSHLWDMQDHTHDGVAPSHGFKVGVGTLASAALHEDLLAHDLGAGGLKSLDCFVERRPHAWLGPVPERFAEQADPGRPRFRPLAVQEQDPEQDREVFDRPGDRPDVVEARREGENARIKAAE